MKLSPVLKFSVKPLLALAALGFNLMADAALPWPTAPVEATQSATPVTMLVTSKDHRMFYEAYNDASDIDGDGTLDVKFKPTIRYYGLFDSDVCYDYNSSTMRYEPKRYAPAKTVDGKAWYGSCTGTDAGQYSGNWMNWMTTSRIDALRKVLYGGRRIIDNNDETVLRRAYVPTDAHSWGKEYKDKSTDGYKISDFTPWSEPTGTSRHFFGNLTDNSGVNCSTLDNCSDLSPVLRTRLNVPSPARIWHWASKERPVLHNDFSDSSLTWGDSQKDYVVQVQVCVTGTTTATTFLNGCKQYLSTQDVTETYTETVTVPYSVTVKDNIDCVDRYHYNWRGDIVYDYYCPRHTETAYRSEVQTKTRVVSKDFTTYKPIGILHEYGEDGTMLFGLMSGSYDNSISGGRLRQNIANFGNEINPNGSFKASPDSPIVTTFNKLRIRDFNNGTTGNQYKGGWLTTGYMTEDGFPDWGNPVGEMLYETARYFANAGRTARFNTSTTKDTAVGLSTATWADPYAITGQNVAACSRSNVLTISDINNSYDSDQLPGAYSAFKDSTFTGTLADLDVTSMATALTNLEFGTVSNLGKRFIGQSGTEFDSAPTPKLVTSLATVRGLAPEEPNKQGSFSPAAMAYYTKTHDLRTSSTSNLDGDQTLDHFVVALSSPLPRITVTTSAGKTVSFVPFAKSTGTAGWGINPAKGNYQPTNQIVDFYVEKIVNSNSADKDNTVNDGRYYAEFQINFEDVEQGADHDMDMIAKYTVKEESDGTVSVQVVPTYAAGSIQQNVGYIVSGAGDRDGVYLVARDESTNPAYYLNVPFVNGVQQKPGYCDGTNLVTTPCFDLPRIGSTTFPTYKFTPGSESAATYLKDPLWYAAKYGGFIDSNGNNKPDLQGEWDNDKDGVPDTYFLVQNPSKLADSLRKAFTSIVERNGSGSNLVANSTSLNSGTHLYQALYNSAHWSGDLMAYGVDADKQLKATPDWKASTRLEALGHAARKIYFTRFVDNVTEFKPEAVEFKASAMNAAELALFESDATHVEYLRGDRTNQVDQSGTLRTRSDTSLIGDITDSSPVYVADTGTVYVGANDGMLHAFDSETGDEKFAFIPSPSLPNMNSLTQVSYKGAHKYYVDGEIVVTSRAQTTNKNILVGLMGRGGKGLFGLNVTDPDSFGTNSIAWEYTEAALAANSLPADGDMGYLLGRPVLAKLQDGTIAAFVGNGYESTNGHAVLYAFNVETGAVLAKLDTATLDSGNGLATPGVVLDGDGKAITVYAGDLKGNLWKFDVSNSSPSAWTVGNAGSPFYVAKDGSGNRQPITGPVTTAINTVYGDANQGKLFVYFGTGSLFRTSDRSDTSQQTLYGLIDSASAGSTKTIADRGNLVGRTFSLTTTLSGSTVRVLDEGTAAELSGKDGFYIDLPESGERVITKPYYGVFVEPTLMFTSAIPSEDLCSPGGRGYLNAINAFTGARLSNGFFDVNNNGDFTDDTVTDPTTGEPVFISSIDLGVGMPSDPTVIGDQAFVNGSDGKLAQIPINTGSTVYRGRLSWREIVVE